MTLKSNLYSIAFSFLFCAAYTSHTFAQQLPHYSQYMFNLYLINPAVAGTSDYYHLNSGYRRQWIGVEGAPTTFYMSGHGHVGKEHKRLRGIHKNQNSWHHGLGFMAYADKSGGTREHFLLSQYNFYVTYAYDMTISKEYRVAFAASMGIKQVGIDQEGARFRGADQNSAVSFNSTNNFIFPDGNAGIIFYHKLWYAGVSNYNMFGQRLRSTPFSEPTGQNRLTRHYFVAGGGLVRALRDPEIDLVPSTILKISEQTRTASADFNTKITYRQLPWKEQHMLWTGFSYRTEEGMVFMIGIKFKEKYEIGYAYDYNLSRLQAASRGSHEFMIGYKIIPNQRILSPSDFWK